MNFWTKSLQLPLLLATLWVRFFLERLPKYNGEVMMMMMMGNAARRTEGMSRGDMKRLNVVADFEIRKIDMEIKSLRLS